jgi:hypothetical protein
MEYKMVFGSLDEFDDKVNELLADGWSLFGSPSMVKHPDGGRTPYFCQAMTKD